MRVQARCLDAQRSTRPPGGARSLDMKLTQSARRRRSRPAERAPSSKDPPRTTTGCSPRKSRGPRAPNWENCRCLRRREHADQEEEQDVEEGEGDLELVLQDAVEEVKDLEQVLQLVEGVKKEDLVQVQEEKRMKAT